MVAWSTHEDPARPMRGRVHTLGSDTEYEAASSGKVPRGQQRRQVLERFQAVGEHGSTDYEMGVALGAFRHACGTRREELIRDGHPIIDSGERRKTDTGRKAIVWKIAALGTPPLSACEDSSGAAASDTQLPSAASESFQLALEVPQPRERFG